MAGVRNIVSISAVTAPSTPATASQSLTAIQNTAGLTVTLDAGGRPDKTFFASVGGAATVTVEGSVDGSNWRILSTTVMIGALDIFPDDLTIHRMRGYRHVRAKTATVGVAVTFEISAI